MATSKKATHLSKFHTLIFAIAIFFSLLPMAFGDVSQDGKEGVQWLWLNFPEGAIISGIIGAIGWIGYFIIRGRLRNAVL